MIERVIVTIGAVLLLFFGARDLQVYLDSNSNELFHISINTVTENGVPGSWVQITGSFVDGSKSYVVRSKKDPENIDVVYYVLQPSKIIKDYSSLEHVLLVKSFNYSSVSDLPEKIAKAVPCCTGVIQGSIQEYHPSLRKELEKRYPGISKTNIFLLHEGKSPSLVRAVIFIFAGMVVFLWVLFLIVADMQSKKHDLIEVKTGVREKEDKNKLDYKYYSLFTLPYTYTQFFITVIGISVSVICLGAVYIRLEMYSTVQHVQFLLLLLFLLITALVTGLLIWLLKTTDWKAVVFFIFYSSALALYSSLFFAAYFYYSSPVAMAQYDPKYLWNTVSDILLQGEFLVAGIPAEKLTLILAASFILELLLAAAFSFLFLVLKPLCSSCHEWVNGKYIISPLTFIESDEVLNKIERTQQFAALKKISKKSNQYSEIAFEYCKKCERFYLLSVRNITVVQNSKGRTIISEPCITQMYITQRAFEAITAEEYFSC